ncbi:MAG TPA: F0F1 ATP synthase subunit delta [Dongiaceae bacterium]|nr:F0F1 ATP synthase subunit delta [Dongiaceae bacterium]
MAQYSNNTILADRYAQALYELADGARMLDRIAGQLRVLKSLINASADLRAFLNDPRLGREHHMRGIEAILSKEGMEKTLVNLGRLLARNRRLGLIVPVIDAYLARLARARGETVAQVTSAVTLSEAQKEALTQALMRAEGGKVSIEARVDPNLLGGLIIQLGSRMIDSSLATKLNKLQYAMKGLG